MDAIVTKKCTKCGIEKPLSEFHKGDGKYGKCAICKPCKNILYLKRKQSGKAYNPEVAKVYYKNNKSAIIEKQRIRYENGGREKSHEYSMAHKEQQRERNIKWKQNNEAKKKEYDRQYRIANKEKLAKYLASTKEQKKEYNKRYIQEHPEKISTKTQNRRARERNAVGSFTETEWQSLCEHYKYTCLKCGMVGKMTPDHVVPLAKGGTNYINNIQPLCRYCNSSKRDKIEDYR